MTLFGAMSTDPIQEMIHILGAGLKLWRGSGPATANVQSISHMPPYLESHGDCVESGKPQSCCGVANTIDNAVQVRIVRSNNNIQQINFSRTV